MPPLQGGVDDELVNHRPADCWRGSRRGRDVGGVVIFWGVVRNQEDGKPITRWITQRTGDGGASVPQTHRRDQTPHPGSRTRDAMVIDWHGTSRCTIVPRRVDRPTGGLVSSMSFAETDAPPSPGTLCNPTQ